MFKSNSKNYLVFLMLLCMSLGSLAQNKRDIQEEAYYQLENREFGKAYYLFDKLYNKEPKNFDYKYRLALCCLSYPEKKARAVDLFEEIQTKNRLKDIDFFLGKAYHLNYRFDEAVQFMQRYIDTHKETKPKDVEWPLVEEAKLLIKNSANGKNMNNMKIKADIRNIGGPVNTEEEEYVPVITTDESVMIYTYRGKNSVGGIVNDKLEPDAEFGYYHEDVYLTSRSGGDSLWKSSEGLKSINTKGHDAAIAISPDGQTLFTFTSTQRDSGDIYVSKLTGSEFTPPVRLNKNINTSSWEGSCSISADGRYLYFASERKGGLGGRDIWVSEFTDGDWGKPKNLGDKINTPYDDDAPFIHPDGITLFFSSKGHSSIGGYDIMFSIKKDNEWLEPKNMGIPLNTTEDDCYYVINSSGTRGYFSSNRGGTGGKGKNDIYVVEPGILGDKPIVAMLKGTVYGDDKPIETKIEVVKNPSSVTLGPYYSNKESGKYLMAVSPGASYRIKIVAEGYETLEEDLDVETLNKYVELKKDFYLYSPPVIAKRKQATLNQLLDSLFNKVTNAEPINKDVVVKNDEPNLKPCGGQTLPDFSSLKGKSLNDKATYEKLLNTAGSYCAEGLVFKVQIAAYRKPENYKYDRLLNFGQPEQVNYPDGITRFTQLQFSNLKEAEVQRQKAIAKGQTDAWVVAFVNGKRYTLEELILLDFLGKSVN
jgi:hypothetical protein